MYHIIIFKTIPNDKEGDRAKNDTEYYHYLIQNLSFIHILLSIINFYIACRMRLFYVHI